MGNSGTGRVGDTFKRLSIDSFRRLCNVELELRPLTVLIGANGTGKSSLLDVLLLLSSSAQGSLNKAISDLSGLQALITYGRAGDLLLGVSMGVPGHEPLDYRLRLALQGAGYAIAQENLSQQPDRDSADPLSVQYIVSEESHVDYFDPNKSVHVRPTWHYEPLETALFQVPKTYRVQEDFRAKLASSTLYHSLDVETRSAIRLPQPIRPAYLPGKNGEDLVSSLYSLREVDRDRFESVEDSLRAAFPTFERLDFPPVAAGTLAMTWRDKNFRDRCTCINCPKECSVSCGWLHF